VAGYQQAQPRHPPRQYRRPQGAARLERALRPRLGGAVSFWPPENRGQSRKESGSEPDFRQRDYAL